MSALVLRRRSRGEHVDCYRPCDTDGCTTNMNGHGTPMGRSVAFFEAIIIDRHCAWLCKRCASEWRRDWDNAAEMKVADRPQEQAA